MNIRELVIARWVLIVYFLEILQDPRWYWWASEQYATNYEPKLLPDIVFAGHEGKEG